ncbi:hypothetical protein IMCC3317_43020 [Kordia antarctica]|uniref:Uncharacterized protein n=1 Tax=Kordia antarctica TaxID=1218801 RepID=A0A7L4ZQN0_9FLAO|nr:hypothetical protein IMCC3317_43020 [Kordia antarctica]
MKYRFKSIIDLKSLQRFFLTLKAITHKKVTAFAI